MENKIQTYNYTHFAPEDYDFTRFDGPKPGTQYIDFEATTLDGKKVHLSDFLDKPVVLETGSVTCPIYANASKRMLKLQQAFPDMHFLLLYIREAHPGNHTHHHTSMEYKVEQAKRLHSVYNETRSILVDDLEGTAHTLYGSMPDMVYVIDTDGTVLFRANWNDFDVLEDVLTHVREHKVYNKDRYKIKKPNPLRAVRTLLIGGWDALFDFFSNLPKLLKQHKQAEENK